MILGIDPGMAGGFVLVDREGYIIASLPMPIDEVNRFIYMPKLRSFLANHRDEIRACYLEYQSARPNQSAPATFKQARIYGALEGVLAFVGIDTYKVTPKSWTALFHHEYAKGGDPKLKTRDLLRTYYPEAWEKLKVGKRAIYPHDGLADAFLISRYGAINYDRDYQKRIAALAGCS